MKAKEYLKTIATKFDAGFAKSNYAEIDASLENENNFGIMLARYTQQWNKNILLS